MRKQHYALAGLVLAAGMIVPGVASASAPDTASAETASVDANGKHQTRCEREFDAAVHEDNDAYNARDVDRYTAILNPRMIFFFDGKTNYGRDAIMDQARKDFAVPGWTWTYSIKSEIVYGCTSGIAVMEAHSIFPARGTDHLFTFTMSLVREHGKWTVAADTVHLSS
ncbi:nuclear transport factor 2 family protein [Solihabitans fulvus]|uniref:Nuclear transport factor 2 family protein n=1 Tax=Solihabitans fulvus TaxID=1892852 RepID=A0A5B2XRA6_9PSEU|nr:nuclear transport factor 2 family protein [Solihabitans fulvus]KAA2266478.1 nuclear transport factor 2 family protein [Solihabitans fulvus]